MRSECGAESSAGSCTHTAAGVFKCLTKRLRVPVSALNESIWLTFARLTSLSTNNGHKMTVNPTKNLKVHQRKTASLLSNLQIKHLLKQSYIDFVSLWYFSPVFFLYRNNQDKQPLILLEMKIFQLASEDRKVAGREWNQQHYTRYYISN